MNELIENIRKTKGWSGNGEESEDVDVTDRQTASQSNINGSGCQTNMSGGPGRLIDTVPTIAIGGGGGEKRLGRNVSLGLVRFAGAPIGLCKRSFATDSLRRRCLQYRLQ